MYSTLVKTPSRTTFSTALGLAKEKFLSLVKGSLVLTEGEDGRGEAGGRGDRGLDSFLIRLGSVVGENPPSISLRSTAGVSALTTANL